MKGGVNKNRRNNNGNNKKQQQWNNDNDDHDNNNSNNDISSNDDNNDWLIIHDNEPPSMALSLIMYLVLPLLVLLAIANFDLIPEGPEFTPVKPIEQGIPIFELLGKDKMQKSLQQKQQQAMERRKNNGVDTTTTAASSSSSGSRNAQSTRRRKSKPRHRPEPKTNYEKQVRIIEDRQRNIRHAVLQKFGKDIPDEDDEYDDDSEETYYHEHEREASKSPKATTTTTTTATTSNTNNPNKQKNAQKYEMDQQIESQRRALEQDPRNEFKALALADKLRERDLIFHDGGSAHVECIQTYEQAIDVIVQKRNEMIAAGEPTNLSQQQQGGSGGKIATDVNAELLIHNYEEKSVDGLLTSAYTSLGKIFFMANMFEKAVEAYDKALEIAPQYLDAISSRGSALIILGKYEQAGRDYMSMLELDQKRLFADTFTGLSRILTANESAVPQGWEPMVTVVEDLIPQITKVMDQFGTMQPDIGKTLADSLKRMHLAMFAYHDVKTQDVEQAWHHLSTGYRVKMAALPKWNGEVEAQRVEFLKQIFHKGFWGPLVGSDLETPIFIIGFVRSGSTLLERVLDAHPMIVGTGEDSILNGRLEHIRDTIVRTAPPDLPDVVRQLAHDVVDGMKERWESLEANNNNNEDDDITNNVTTKVVEPRRFADKMLTNYNNVGFIHLLFPKALILHVAREPMDTIFSAFKHDFPPGTLDYTSDFPSLAQLYHCYRNVIEHWDTVLPGRVTHIRYEDMVHDMPGMARAIIDATGLPWDPEVLRFHEKKQAVNTLSTTQVRKGVYKHSLNSWKKYERQLQPLVELISDRVNYDLQTTLPNYVRPAPSSTTTTTAANEEEEQEEEQEKD